MTHLTKRVKRISIVPSKPCLETSDFIGLVIEVDGWPYLKNGKASPLTVGTLIDLFKELIVGLEKGPPANDNA